MKRNNVFWGIALILVGLLFFLQARHVIPSALPYIFPLAMLFAGFWLVLSVYWKPKPSAEDQFEIAIGDAKSVNYKFSHGAGQIEIKGGAGIGKAMAGLSTSGIKKSSRLAGDRLEVRVEAGASFIPFVGPPDGVWRFLLTNEIPVTLDIEIGASQLTWI